MAQSKEDVKQRRIDEGRLSGRELCEGGLVETGGKEDAGAMEYIKRDTSADDAAEARAKEEAERNLARDFLGGRWRGWERQVRLVREGWTGRRG